MKSFCESLVLDLETQLQHIRKESDNNLQLSERAVTVIRQLLDQLESALAQYTFTTEQEEIDFYRTQKPQLLSRLIYYTALYSIEAGKPLGGRKTQLRYFRNELNKLERFYFDNIEFCRYYKTGQNYLDCHYFTARNTNASKFHYSWGIAHPQFIGSYDVKVAKLIANEQLMAYIEGVMVQLEYTVPVNSDTVKPQTTWTASKVEMVELIYALHAEGVFGYGRASLKEIAGIFEQAFQIDLGQFHKTFVEIRARKSERARFLTGLREKLLIRMDEADQ